MIVRRAVRFLALMSERLTLTEAAREVETYTGISVHRSTIDRWSKQGIQVGTERVKLRRLRVGARWYINARELRDFLERIQVPA